MDFNNENDLGLDIELPADNLFQMFHEKQDASTGKSTPIDITDPLKPGDTGNDGNTGGDTGKGKPAGGTPPKTTAADAEPGNNPDLSPEKLEELRKQSSNGAGAGADPNKNSTGGDNTPASASVFQALYEDFTERLGYEPLEDFDGSEEKFIEFQEKQIEKLGKAHAEEMITQAFQANPQNAPVAKDLLKFLANGGDVQTFIETRRDDNVTAEFLNVTDDAQKEERAKIVISQYYASIGWGKETIDKFIKTNATAGTLNDVAADVLPEFIKARDARKTMADQQAVNQAQTNKENIRKFNSTILETLDKTDEFHSFDLKDKKTKEAIKNYMFSPTEKVGETSVPKFMVDLQKANANPAFRLFQALVLQKGGIDLANLETKIQTATKSSLQEKLEAAQLGKRLEQPASSNGNSNSTTQDLTKTLDFDNLVFA